MKFLARIFSRPQFVLKLYNYATRASDLPNPSWPADATGGQAFDRGAVRLQLERAVRWGGGEREATTMFMELARHAVRRAVRRARAISFDPQEPRYVRVRPLTEGDRP